MSKTYMLFMTAVLLDTLGNILFKVGANKIEDSVKAGWLGHWENVLLTIRRKEILLGLIVYVFEYIIWISFLSTAQLSKAFPMYSLTIVLILLVSYFYLNEQVSKKRWFGAVLILVGVTLLGSNS